MKIQYLGTGGGGGIPEMFCSCRICENARLFQNREIRNRHMAVINNELCIDLPCDARSSFLERNINAQKIRYLLVTHNHYDHFLADNLISRSVGAQPIQVFISRGSGQEIFRKAERLRGAMSQENVRPVCIPDVHFIRAFIPFQCGKYKVTPLPAHHDSSVETMNFLIEEDKNILWLHDTGLMLPETEKYLRNCQTHIDFVSMDCSLPRGRYISNEHMDILRCNTTAELLRNAGCIDDDTLIYLSHISHLVECTHEELCLQANEYNFQVASDGEEITLI